MGEVGLERRRGQTSQALKAGLWVLALVSILSGGGDDIIILAFKTDPSGCSLKVKCGHRRSPGTTAAVQVSDEGVLS